MKPINGIISVCTYCGEQVGNTQKFCPQCKTKDGRKKMFDENVEIFKQNETLGYKVPTDLKSWK